MHVKAQNGHSGGGRREEEEEEDRSCSLGGPFCRAMAAVGTAVEEEEEEELEVGVSTCDPAAEALHPKQAAFSKSASCDEPS